MALSLLLVWGYNWATSSEYFLVRQIEVQGQRHLKRERVLGIAGVSAGQNILGLNLAEIESRLRQESWVQQVRLSRRLPDKLVINIQEKEAIFWVLEGEQVFYADQEARPISPVQARNFVSLPLLAMDRQDAQQQKHLRHILVWLQSRKLPFSLAEVAWLRFASEEIVEIHLQDQDILIRFGSEHLDQNLFSLGKVWRELKQKEELERVQRFVIFHGLCWVRLKSGVQ